MSFCVPLFCVCTPVTKQLFQFVLVGVFGLLAFFKEKKKNFLLSLYFCIIFLPIFLLPLMGTFLLYPFFLLTVFISTQLSLKNRIDLLKIISLPKSKSSELKCHIDHRTCVNYHANYVAFDLPKWLYSALMLLPFSKINARFSCCFSGFILQIYFPVVGFFLFPLASLFISRDVALGFINCSLVTFAI